MTLLFLIELIVFTALLIPTLIAMIYGAPWVPTPDARVRRMLELGKLKPGDRIYDLGCGDGRIPHLAAKLYGADAVGFELSPMIYCWGRIRNFFLRSQSQLLFRDFRRMPMNDAKAVFFYLMPDTLKRLKQKFAEELQPDALIISYAFKIEGWEPVYIEPKNPEKNLSPIYLYQIPVSMYAHGNPAKT